MELRFVPPRENVAAYVDLELLASDTYAIFVYSDLSTARRFHARLVQSEVGEFGGSQAVLALDDLGEPVGMFAGPFDKRSLSRARIQAASALLRDPEFSANADFRARAAASRSALLAPEEGEVYLSRIAVAPAARRRGVGRALLTAFFERSREMGARRAVVDVSPTAEEALAMYRAAGFADVGDAAASLHGRILHYKRLMAPVVGR